MFMVLPPNYVNSLASCNNTVQKDLDHLRIFQNVVLIHYMVDIVLITPGGAGSALNALTEQVQQEADSVA